MMSSHEYEMAEVLSDDNIPDNADNIRIQLKDTSTFTNLYHAYLEVKIKLKVEGTNNPATDIADGVNITLANGINSLFSRCVLRVQNQIVETLDEQHLTYMVKSLLHYSEDYARSSGTNELYFKDTGNLDADADARRAFNHPAVPDGGSAENAILITENPNYNSGFLARKARTNDAAEVTAIIPLASLFGFCGVDRVMSGNQIAIELTRSPRVDHLHKETAAAPGAVLIKHCSLWTPRILPNAEVELALKSALGGGVVSDYRFPTYNSYVSSNLTTAAGSNVFKVLTQNEKILHAFVFLRKSITSQDDPKQLTRDEINTLEVRLNGRTYPSRRYDNLNSEEGKVRAYFELLNYMNRGDDYSSGIQLSYEEWKTRSIYSFDLSNQPENWSKSPSTLEVAASLQGSGGVDRQWTVVVVSERAVQINYSGSMPVVTVM
jgi:hypothetical protein